MAETEAAGGMTMLSQEWGEQECKNNKVVSSLHRKPPRPGSKDRKKTFSAMGPLQGRPERPIYLSEDRAFGNWLEMAAKQGRQNPQQLMPSISGIVDDMNNMRAGKSFRRRAASDFAWAMEGIQAPEIWLRVAGVVPLKMVCKAFMEGREATTFQQLAVRGNALVSMDQVANLSHPELAELLSDYLGRISALLPQAKTASASQEYAQSAIIHLTKEATVLRLAHVIGRPSNMHTYAEQKSASVPIEELRRVIEVGAFTEVQAGQMWDCWYLVCAAMIHLKAQEVSLQAQAQSATEQATKFPDRIANYCSLLTTAAELKRNLEQQANLVFRFNCQCSMTILTPWQAILCQEAMSPRPFRPHLLFLSGLFPKRYPTPSEPSPLKDT